MILHKGIFYIFHKVIVTLHKRYIFYFLMSRKVMTFHKRILHVYSTVTVTLYKRLFHNLVKSMWHYIRGYFII